MIFLPFLSRFRLAAVSTLISLAAPSCVTSVPIGKPAPISDSAEIRKSLRQASRLMIHEGLPHQTQERRLMEQEAKRNDVHRILGYPFYAPPAAAKNRDKLQRILSDEGSYAVYTGPKTCGGFHPDYDVEWTSGGRKMHVQICFGCGEALFADGANLIPYDFRDEALAEVKSALSVHAVKRPPVQQ